MLKITKHYTSLHSLEQVYSVISDIKAYPQFIDLCQKIDIIDSDHASVTAQVLCKVAAISYDFRCSISFFPPNANRAEISISGLNGPHVTALWVLEKNANGTDIHFSINIKLNRALQYIALPIAESWSDKVYQAFKERILLLYPLSAESC